MKLVRSHGAALKNLLPKERSKSERALKRNEGSRFMDRTSIGSRRCLVFSALGVQGYLSFLDMFFVLGGGRALKQMEVESPFFAGLGTLESQYPKRRWLASRPQVSVISPPRGEIRHAHICQFRASSHAKSRFERLSCSKGNQSKNRFDKGKLREESLEQVEPPGQEKLNSPSTKPFS